VGLCVFVRMDIRSRASRGVSLHRPFSFAYVRNESQSLPYSHICPKSQGSLVNFWLRIVTFGDQKLY
jgi:hypothetical protein